MPTTINPRPRSSARSSSPPPRPETTIRAISGTAASRSAPTAYTAMPARCSRRGSGLICGEREVGDPVAHLVGGGDGQQRDLVAAGGGVDHDGGEPELL